MINFLNVKKDLPIVAHKVKYDRDKVLFKAFKKLGIENMMPKKERWRCTLVMCEREQEIISKSLEECVNHFNIKGRKDERLHDSMEDCLLTAQVYMELMKIAPPKIGELGFDFEEKD